MWPTQKMGKIGLIALGCAWVALFATGTYYAMRYDSTPGRASSRTPVVSKPSGGKWKAVMVVHPNCPCSKASLEALREVMARYGDAMTCEIYIAGDAAGSKNLDYAKNVPGAKVVVVTPEEAVKKLGAHTSGQAYVFDGNGKMVYSGGLTPGRGAYDTRFATDVVGSLLEGKPAMNDYSVFGCPLEDARS